ncbi:MAG: hypothetical protein NWE92_04930 [Candidatus Bathyarchaeota archaeon]|nr:hypothetical protein [Candidatus Bathyarchaeota archaeon]
MSLYVGVAVFAAPQDGLRKAMLFWVATFFGVCFGVGAAILSTCPA